MRVPHGRGEINLVVEVVGGDEEPAGADFEQTSVHAPVNRRSRPSTQAPEGRSEAREFVLGPGGRVSKYELKDKLGQGTFGLVFTARDLDLDRDVAVKILNPSHATNGDILHRFLQEARASARIAHPGIVTVLDCGKVGTHVGETAWIVLELLKGESLTSRITRSGRLAPSTAVEIARQIASALDAAHRSDVLHRDLKPDNIFLVPDPAVPSGERVKVLDFGLAKLGASKHTTMNTVFGTPRYMSPEQCRSATLIDHRSDIYSLGCMLFELVTGRTPFDGDLRQLLDAHQRITPPRAKQLVPEIPKELDDLIATMLAKDPNQRPQSMAAVQTALYGHGAVAPGAAATMMPVAAEAVRLPPQPMAVHPHMPSGPQAMQPMQPMPQHANDSGMLLVPGSGGGPAQPYRHGTAATRGPRRRKAPIAVAAIAFFIAAAATAVIARGKTRSAVADPAPVTTPAEGSNAK